MDKSEYIGKLLVKYNQKQLTEEEHRFLEDWANSNPSNQIVFDEFNPNHIVQLSNKLHRFQNAGDSLTFDAFLRKNKINNKQKRRTRKIWWYSVAAAACVILAGFIGYNYLKIEAQYPSKPSLLVTSTMPHPGKVGALLLTDNGLKQEINLAVNINFNSNGQLVEAGLVDEKQMATAEMISLIIPKGNNYKVVLSDGTKVWLNSHSRISFPKQFGSDRRQVSVEGEAYFEVAPDKNKPFIVHHERQDIIVLGTHFNVKCYADDKQVMTTLFEGRVNVKENDADKRLLLVPGEESVLGEIDFFTKRKADLAAVAAWRNGLFSFHNTPFSEVLKQISRWYNVDVIYKSALPNETFTGQVDRSVDFDLILKFLKGSGIVLEYKEGKLIIH